jgi:tetratricopeptide (TPR) repeat protein
MSSATRDFYREVTSLIRQNREDAALSRLQVWLSERPDDEVGLSLKGSALLRTGQVDEAIGAFRHAVARHPGSFAAHGDLGFALFRGGKIDQAIAAFRTAVGLNGRFYQGWCYLSQLLFEAGDVPAAQEAFRRSEGCDPFVAEFEAVQAAMGASRFAEAEKLCRALLARQSGYPRAAYCLAQLASQVGAFEEAASILRAAIHRYPCDISLRSALVVSLEESGHYDLAVDEAKTIAGIKPDAAGSWLVLGRVHGHCGSYEDALQCYDKALVLAGSAVEAGNAELLRGHVLKILGRYDDSIEAYRSSIRKLPGNGAGWWGLADMKTYRFSDDEVREMRQISNDPSVRAEQRTQAAFALGKACEDRARYDDAFSWYRLGNELRTGVTFDPAVQRDGIEQIIRSFDQDVLRVQAEPPPQGPTPVFIVGLPRSGSTLVEQILASHSLIEGTMELATLPNIVRRISIDGGRRKLGYPASIASFTKGELAAYGQAYLDDTAMYRSGKPYFIDKLPTNFDKIGLIHKILPQAIIIDARRHPLDCGFSCYKQHFAGGHLFSYSLENIGHYYNTYLRLMDYWEAVLPGKVLSVSYEALVGDTEATVRSLLARCGMAYEDACLAFFENRRPVRTASSEQVRQPVYSQGVGYWRRFESHLEPLIKTLGDDTLSRFRA